MRSTQIRLARRPIGEPKDHDFELTTSVLPPIRDGEVLLRTIYLSLDPYMRGRMSAARSYADPVPIGDVMVGETVCEVIESASDQRAVGELVLAYTGWQTHAVVDASATRIVNRLSGPPSTALGVLGMPGFTAYAGLLEIGQPQKGETVAVAAATGPVGSAVGQIAKLKGAKAIGIAGGGKKVRALTEEFGFDVGLDHRDPFFREALEEASPDGIDVYFENVGGHVTAEVSRRLNTFARIPVCGLVANYNDSELPPGRDRLPAFMSLVLTRSLRVRGFIQDEFEPALHEDFLVEMGEWVRTRAVRYREDVAQGLESAPEALRGLLTGRNFGKLLIQVGPESQ